MNKSDTAKLQSISDADITALTLYGEVRGESIEGTIAAGNVIRNRVNKWKKTYREICLQPNQFSCWNSNDPNYVILIETSEKIFQHEFIGSKYQEVLWVAIGLMNNQLLDNVNGALYYLTNELYHSPNIPTWARTATYSTRIGNQVYFNV